MNGLMDIVPAIDLKSGKCVRLRQGRDEATTRYEADPLELARRWEREGARRIHIVNLDGAFGRASQNLEVMRRVAGGVQAAVQYGGGLRSLEAMEGAISAGAAKLVLGTAAVEQPDLLRAALRRFGPRRVIVALDSADGRVATKGWTVVSDLLAVNVARSLRQAGVREILSTDIARDGMLTGPNLQALQELASAGLEILASGGVSSSSDVRAIRALAEPRITGVIVGKALYEGRVMLPELLQAARSDGQ